MNFPKTFKRVNDGYVFVLDFISEEKPNKAYIIDRGNGRVHVVTWISDNFFVSAVTGHTFVSNDPTESI